MTLMCFPRAYVCLRFFFFFQAEDGIRDWSVTVRRVLFRSDPPQLGRRARDLRGTAAQARGGRHEGRSEERRVGKECRSRWGPYPEKKIKHRGVETMGQTKSQRESDVRRRCVRGRMDEG